MTHKEFLTLTSEQKWSLFRLFNRESTRERKLGVNYMSWLDKYVCNYGDYVGVEWCNMFVGIERDGYTHT